MLWPDNSGRGAPMERKPTLVFDAGRQYEKATLNREEGAREASEWLFRLRSRIPEELSVVRRPASRHANLKFSMVVDGESVSVSVTKVAFPANVLLKLKPTVQLGPEQLWNGQSGEPQETWASEDDAEGSKELSHGSG